MAPVLPASDRLFSFCHTFNNMWQYFLANVVFGHLFRWFIVYPVTLLGRFVPPNVQLCGLIEPFCVFGSRIVMYLKHNWL